VNVSFNGRDLRRIAEQCGLRAFALGNIGSDPGDSDGDTGGIADR
jgi:hypothetical protein